MSSKKGSNFENYVKQKLKMHDFDIYRSSASKGVFDLIVLTPNSNPVLGVQCKAHGRISSFERQRMIDTANHRNIVPVLATKVNNVIVFIDLSRGVVIKDFGEYERL